MMNKKFRVNVAAIIFCLSAVSYKAHAQADTVRVMAYNVLNYGVYCQGPNSIYHNYLKTIVQYDNPDIISLEKMGSIPMYQGDIHGVLPIGFGDSILQFALNAAFPGRYAYCPFSNIAGANDMSMLFYNQAKLGFVSVTFIYPNVTDFDCYKLYYKDPNLSTTHDTTFLYIIPNHDISGSSSVSDRGAQIAGYMQDVKNHFSHLPNMISMGDFNLRYTSEPLYQTLTAPSDTDFRFYDPPFSPDNHFTYPGDWDDNPATYTAYLTTSTRASATEPNSCGTDGGGKNWYDHIFISPWIVDNANYVRYIPNSYRTIGNDGNRLSVSADATSPVANTSAPADVIEAIYQMSNKYPISVDLAITPNTSGISPADPELANTLVGGVHNEGAQISIVNPANEYLSINFPSAYIGNRVNLLCYDAVGRRIIQKDMDVTNTMMQLPFDVIPGVYFVKIFNQNTIYQVTVVKK